jgi:glycosyltransferase involved in cell wall biosynthesis
LVSRAEERSAVRGLGPMPKKLLFVTHVFPYPLDRGERVRVLNLLQACARDFDVTLVVVRPPGAAAENVPECVSKVVFVEMDGEIGADWRLQLRAIRSSIGMPFGGTSLQRRQFLRALDTLDLAEYQLIWAERPHLARLFAQQCARTVVDLDDVEHLRLRRLMRLQRASRAWAHNLYRYLVYRRAECRLFRNYLRVAICSEHDSDYLRAQHAGIPWIVPNGAFVPATRPPLRRRAAGEPLRLVFLGNMSHPPNADAVRFFAEQVLPRAQEVTSGLDVIGPNVTEDLRRACGSGVNFRGFVADLATALRDYDAMVAPIRFGGGTKLKMIEGMANGLPLVATPCAAEGLDLIDGRHALLSASPESMLLSLQRLQHSDELSEHLAAAAFAHARARFSWDSIQATVATELSGLVAAVAGRAEI